jgi:coenzyme F420 hydrogenase subunit beta
MGPPTRWRPSWTGWRRENKRPPGQLAVREIKTLAEVVDWRLCIGCGACASVCPNDQIQLWDFLREGIRPVVEEKDCGSCRQCLEVCPAVETDFSIPGATRAQPGGPGALGDAAFVRDWGRVLEVWEGHASDPAIRFQGSSGGALTALAAYCVEQGGMHGVLHTAQHPQAAVRNQTRLSRTRAELLAATGSRYSPASVCDSLDRVEQAPAPCVVIGKPGEISALTKARKLRPALDTKVGATLSFFCAETPATAGTVALLERMAVRPDSVADLRYRGFGWPGHFAPTRHGEAEPCGKMTYQDSWAFLQSFRPWSVHLWPDGSGELADISCGDPWYEQPDGKNPGASLVVVRTQNGREILRRAMAAGYLQLRPADPWKLARSQTNLANKKAATWGRLLAVSLFGLPIPRFPGAPLFRCWLGLPLKEKIKSVFGTARRIIDRKLYRPLKLDRSTAVVVKDRIQP